MFGQILHVFAFYVLPVICLAWVSDVLRKSNSSRLLVAAEILFILSIAAELLRLASAFGPGRAILPAAEDFIMVHQWLVTGREWLFAAGALLLAIWAFELSRRLKGR